MAVSSPFLSGTEKKPWWLSNRQIADKYIKDARALIATGEQRDICSALNLLEAALALSPEFEQALELKARSLLYLRRFKDVADLLQDYIPSFKMENDDSGSDGSSQQLSREQVKLLSSTASPRRKTDPPFKCFSFSDFKKKLIAGFRRNDEKEKRWRYTVLGQACCHLGLMEDAVALLQTGKRLASAALRLESKYWSDDTFSFSYLPIPSSNFNSNPPTTPPRYITESETVTNFLNRVKLLLRRRTAALAALDTGFYSEAIRHFTKIIDGRRGAPQAFLAESYMYRAYAYRSLGRIAESIADCNRTLALDPTCIHALETRASLLESIRCFPDCLHDLEHLKLLYNSILRDKKLPGPAWKLQNVRYREIPGKLCALSTKIQELKQRITSGEIGTVDYYALIGLPRGCSRSELERAHLLLCLRHKPDKATNFIDRCELGDDGDVDSVKDRAKLGALFLYRLVQKGYSSVMVSIMEEEAVEKKRKKAVEAAAQATIQVEQQIGRSNVESILNQIKSLSGQAVFQGGYCRDIAAVGNLMPQVGFSLPIAVKYEALSC